MQIQPAELGQADAVVALVHRVFDEFIAPDYPDEGVAHFYANVTVDGLVKAIREDEIVMLAIVDDMLAGVVQVLNETHITWLYVDRTFHGRGIGRKLVLSAVGQIRERTPEAAVITLNSSPYAVSIYRRMGFEPGGSEKIKDGVRMTPMRAGIETFVV